MNRENITAAQDYLDGYAQDPACPSLEELRCIGRALKEEYDLNLTEFVACVQEIQDTNHVAKRIFEDITNGVVYQTGHDAMSHAMGAVSALVYSVGQHEAIQTFLTMSLERAPADQKPLMQSLQNFLPVLIQCRELLATRLDQHVKVAEAYIISQGEEVPTGEEDED